MIRAAIVGLGWWGRTLVGAVQGKSDAIRFVAGHNRTRAKAEAFCRDHGIALHDDLSAILRDPGIDAIVFAARHSQHDAQVAAAAGAGKHVFVEKPFALTLAAADAALDAVTKAGVVLGIGYQRRFHPSMIELRARVRDGRLGTIAHVEGEATAHAGLHLPAESWRVDPNEAPAGAMTALGVHILDGMIDLFGPVDEVYCMSLRRAAQHIDDTTSVMLRFESGVSGTLVCALSSAVSYRFAVFGSRGIGEISNQLATLRFVAPPDAPPGSGQLVAPPPEVIDNKGFDAVRANLEAFAAAAAGRAPYATTPEQLRQGVAAFEAIVRSAATRRPVTVA